MNNNNALPSTQEASPVSTSNQFLLTSYPSSKILDYTREPIRCILGNAPRLSDVEREVGEENLAKWVQLQLLALMEFYTLKEKMTTFQMFTLSRIIIQRYGFMKLPEIMLFVRLFWEGKFGKVFNNIGAQDIIDALQQYLRREKNEIIARNLNNP